MGVAILIVSAAASIGALGKASQRRAFRDVGGMVGYVVLALLLAAIGASTLLWPNAWDSFYEGVLDLLYGGGD